MTDTPATTTVYGASDDLIEVDGQIREEFNVIDEPRYLAFSDGTVLRIEYTSDGCWAVDQRAKGSCTIEKVHDATDDDDEPRRPDGTPTYSDVVVLTGDISWVVCGADFVRAAGVQS